MLTSELSHLVTNDGSSTLFSSRFGQHYHSIYGAITESMHVFIRAGLQDKHDPLNEIAIFEMGMGTGLNVLLTYLHKEHKSVSYTCIEAYPLVESQWSQLNYGSHLKEDKAQAIYQLIHEAPWNQKIQIDPQFELHKIRGTIEALKTSALFHTIYFDAFAPDAQPELWNEQIFKKLYNMTQVNGVLTTYSAKGAVRRTLAQVGYQVEKLPGPPGKREMLRAHKVEIEEPSKSVE